MVTVKTHPLMEIIAKKLSGINQVPKEERDRMVVRACKAAMNYHENFKKEAGLNVGEIINVIKENVNHIFIEDDEQVNEYRFGMERIGLLSQAIVQAQREKFEEAGK